MIEALESLREELKEKRHGGGKFPRILLTGSTLAQGDSKVLDILKDLGATVVMEEFAEGMRPYWQNVDLDGNLINTSILHRMLNKK